MGPGGPNMLKPVFARLPKHPLWESPRMDEESDPEACYRRGYEHGAEEVFRAVAAALRKVSAP